VAESYKCEFAYEILIIPALKLVSLTTMRN